MQGIQGHKPIYEQTVFLHKTSKKVETDIYYNSNILKKVIKIMKYVGMVNTKKKKLLKKTKGDRNKCKIII